MQNNVTHWACFLHRFFTDFRLHCTGHGEHAVLCVRICRNPKRVREGAGNHITWAGSAVCYLQPFLFSLFLKSLATMKTTEPPMSVLSLFASEPL